MTTIISNTNNSNTNNPEDSKLSKLDEEINNIKQQIITLESKLFDIKEKRIELMNSEFREKMFKISDKYLRYIHQLFFDASIYFYRNENEYKCNVVDGYILDRFDKPIRDNLVDLSEHTFDNNMRMIYAMGKEYNVVLRKKNREPSGMLNGSYAPDKFYFTTY
jgi:hypothetical protein